MKDAVENAKFVLRIPPKLHKKIKRLASEDTISMNSYIIQTLEDQIKPQFSLKSLIQRMEAKNVI